MTCKDCMHYDKCLSCINYMMDIDVVTNELINDMNERCRDFKDKSKYIELPCKVGDKAYFIWNFNEPEIQECEVKGFKINTSGAYVVLDYVDCIGHHNKGQFLISHITKTVFLTKFEAEQKLKELLGDN